MVETAVNNSSSNNNNNNNNNNNKMKKKIVSLSEEDVCSLLQRYSAATILSVLGEVSRYPKSELNWDEILSNTSSGIKSASHLQLLWRHLAYRLPLDNINNIDYDSDLDIEVQPYPYPHHASIDAASCVTLLASASASPSAADNLVEPDNVSIPPPPAPTPTPLPPSQGLLDPNVSRKKRKWTHDEDSKLLASVNKLGEGNWHAIAKHSLFGRSPAQLSQRWAHMKKKQASVNVGAATSAGTQLSEAQLATRRAIDMALKDNLPAVGNGAAVTTNPAKPKPSNGESPAITISVPAQRQLSQATNTTSLKAAPGSTVPKPRPALKKAPPKPPSISDTIQRTAVAAGARIVNPSDAEAFNNYASVHFFRTGAVGSTVSVGAVLAPFANGSQQPAAAVSQLPKAKTMPAVSSSGSANDSLKKKEERTSMEANVPCSETKQMLRAQETNASLPRCLPKAQPVNSRSTSPGLTKQTSAIINSESAISNGNTPSEGKDETLKHVLVNPVLVDVSDNLSATQVSCIPSVNGKLESFSCSIADGSSEKMKSSIEGLNEAK